jgi:peptide/nickel transport system ATP-binding protein
MDNSPFCITVNDLSIRFSPTKPPIFDKVSFRVPSQQVFGLFGPTGCGKSSLAQMLIGLIPKSCVTGDLTLQLPQKQVFHFQQIQEKDWNKIRGKQVLYIPQDPYKTMNPFETIQKQLQRAIHHANSSLSLHEVFDKIGLPRRLQNCLPARLSAGQLQRCILSHSLIFQPAVIVFDEPTASMDRKGRKQFLETLQSLLHNGKTLLIISHEQQLFSPIIRKENRYCFLQNTSANLNWNITREKTNHCQNVIELRNISLKLGDHTVFHQLDFAVAQKQWVYLEGENGAGKSTLFQLLSGYGSSSGAYIWCGETISWSQVLQKTKTFLHLAFQDAFHAFNPRLSMEASILEVFQQIGFARKIDVWQSKEEVLATSLGLSHDLWPKLPHELSYGQQKRFSLLRSLLKLLVCQAKYPNQPHVLLCDEVFAGVHENLRVIITKTIMELSQDKNLAVIWIAHGQDELKRLCDKVYFIQDKKLVLEQ